MGHAFTTHTQHLVDMLVAARARARSQLHLLSHAARDDWQELESQLDCLQSRIEYEGDKISASAPEKVRELVESVTQFLREQASPGFYRVAS